LGKAAVHRTAVFFLGLLFVGLARVAGHRWHTIGDIDPTLFGGAPQMKLRLEGTVVIKGAGL
jgi:hypothetical protein